MRVAFAIGRPDPIFDPTTGARKEDDVAYWTSAILKDLREACAARRWPTDMLLMGQDGGQEVRAPDVVVNLISEPLVCDQALTLLAGNAARHGFKVLNTPAATRRAGRVNLAQLKAPGVVIPRTTWHQGLARDLAGHIRDAGHRWPVLLRPPGAHGSLGLIKVDAEAELAPRESRGGWLVSDFHDFRSADGLWRKYRVISVGGKLFRRHLIIGDQWNITGAARAFMVGKPALIDEEKAFLAASGGRSERALSALFAEAGLDFAVADYARDSAGNVVVFELNGCFQISGSIPADKRERWGYLDENNAALVAAIMDLIAARA